MKNYITYPKSPQFLGCNSAKYRCDGIQQCPNGEDEEGCPSTSNAPGTTPPITSSTMQVTNGTTIMTSTTLSPTHITTQKVSSTMSPSTSRTEVPSTEVTETSQTKVISTTMVPPTTRRACSKFLNGKRCSVTANPDMMRIRLPSKNKVTGYKISGSDLGFVKSFKLLYKAKEGDQFDTFSVRINKNEKQEELTGNTASSLESTHFFPNEKVIDAKIVKVIVTKWKGNSNAGFCFQLLGCEYEGKSTTLVYTTKGVVTTTTVKSKSTNMTVVTEYTTTTTPRASTSESIEVTTPHPSSGVTSGSPQQSGSTPASGSTGTSVTGVTSKSYPTGQTTGTSATSEKPTENTPGSTPIGTTAATQKTTGKENKTPPPGVSSTKKQTASTPGSTPSETPSSGTTKKGQSTPVSGTTSAVPSSTAQTGGTGIPSETTTQGSTPATTETSATKSTSSTPPYGGSTSPTGGISYSTSGSIPTFETTVQPTTKLSTTVPLPCSEQDEKINNSTICYECDCVSGYWKCQTYCHETCKADEKLIQQEGACCFCAPKPVSSTLAPTTTTSTYHQCKDDVEIENLPDDHFTSNDGDGSNIKFNKSECWSPTINDAFVEVDLGKDTIVSGYRISGLDSGYVETFTISYKSEGETEFVTYKDESTQEPHVFTANTKDELDVDDLFPDGKSIVVNSVRLHPTKLSSDNVCVKFDLVGCTKITTVTPTPTGAISTRPTTKATTLPPSYKPSETTKRPPGTTIPPSGSTKYTSGL